jgi:hypothetical protein
MKYGGIFFIGLLVALTIVSFSEEPVMYDGDGYDDEYQAISDYEAGIAAEAAQFEAQAEMAQISGDTIISSLGSMGAESVWTNGYAYEFVLNDSSVTVFDQHGRIVGELHKTPANDSEAQMLEDAHTILLKAEFDRDNGLSNSTSMYISLAEDIVKDYRYTEFCIDGYPAYAVLELEAMV